MKQVRKRYAQLRQSVISFSAIDAFFDSHVVLLNEAKDRHFQKYANLFSDGKSQQGWMFPGMGGNANPVAFFAAYQVKSYQEEIQTVKGWFRKRIAFLDREWGYEPGST